LAVLSLVGGLYTSVAAGIKVAADYYTKDDFVGLVT
jgi:hypothetical protein